MRSARWAAQLVATRPIDSGATPDSACPVTTWVENSADSKPAKKPATVGEPRSSSEPVRYAPIGAAASCNPWRSTSARACEYRALTSTATVMPLLVVEHTPPANSRAVGSVRVWRASHELNHCYCQRHLLRRCGL